MTSNAREALRERGERLHALHARGELFDSEKPWLHRFDFLKARGYLLRPRYRPDWVAPWKPDDDLREIEEAIGPMVSMGHWLSFL